MSMWRVRTAFSGPQGAPWLNTLFFDTAGGTAGQAVAAAGAFWGAVDAYISNSVSWGTENEVYSINEANGQPTAVTQVTSVTGTGSQVGPLLSRATQGLIRLGTGVFVNGREVRGRIFVPGMTTAALNNGAIDSGAASALDAAALALHTGPNATLVVWSRKNGRMEGVIASSTWGQFAVLRSRRD